MLNRTPSSPEWRSPITSAEVLVMVSTLLLLFSGCVIHVLENVRLSDVNPTSQCYESGFPEVPGTTDMGSDQHSQPNTGQDRGEVEVHSGNDSPESVLDREGFPDIEVP